MKTSQFLKQFLSFGLSLLFMMTYASEKELTIPVKDTSVKGTLTIPNNTPSNAPLVIIISGSGPTDRDGNNPQNIKSSYLKMIAQDLDKNGIASFRYDKRGIAQSRNPEIPESDLTFNDYINDASDICNYFAREKKYNQIILLGHSEGGQIAINVAATNTNVSKIIAIAAPGRNIEEIMLEQLNSLPQTDIDDVKKAFECMRNNLPVKPQSQISKMIFRPSVVPYMKSWINNNPADIIKRLKIPVFLICGSTDIQVKPVDAQNLKSAYPKATLLTIENMNHPLKEINSINQLEQMKSYSSPDLPLHPQLMPPIIAFIKN
ncbi:MAG: alpha/beta hydrolase [Bacteroidales bacterium]